MSSIIYHTRGLSRDDFWAVLDLEDAVRCMVLVIMYLAKHCTKFFTVFQETKRHGTVEITTRK